MTRFLNTSFFLLLSLGLHVWANLPFSGRTPGLLRYSDGVPDTLEIYGFKVEFKEETTDNSLTTGNGLFDSDLDTAGSNYSLDPRGSRASAEYWLQQLEFAANYFKAASGGRLVIESKIFPRKSRSYQLDNYMIDYNRTSRQKDEKVAEYDEAKARDYVRFAYDAIMKAHSNQEDSPFMDSLPSSPHRKRVYLLIHAGASRLLDGGSMGTLGADTPGDFMDIYLPSDSWTYLEDTKTHQGIPLPGAPLDTLKELMVVSETASQDGLNWGIHGILIQQIGRQIGMPATYDIVQGISRLGYFDAMDFAGSNAGNGFLPVLPSAWVRSYMGWSTVQEVHPDDMAQAVAKLKAAGASGPETAILKVPLSSQEYLLIENRQRTLEEQGDITMEVDGKDIVIPVDSLHLMFQDSICNDEGKDCQKNTRKASGLLTSISHYDAGLPASGVVVWHVNEWFLRQALPYGAVNFWAGDTFRDHQYGIALIEADGVLSIGKEFKDATGSAAFDYGSGADLLPHQIVNTNKEDKTVPDTVVKIRSSGYANTASTFGGFSGIEIRVPVPADAQREKTSHAFMGDSVYTWRKAVMSVEIDWGNFRLPQSQWPRRTATSNGFQSVVMATPPQALSGLGKMAIAASSDGHLQFFNAQGGALVDTLETRWVDLRYDSVTTLLETPAQLDSAVPVPVFAAPHVAGHILGMATLDSQLVVTTQEGLLLRYSWTHAGDSTLWIQVDSIAGLVNPTTPMITLVEDTLIWVADTQGLYAANWKGDLKWTQKIAVDWQPHQLALCGTTAGQPYIAAVARDHQFWLLQGSQLTSHPFAGDSATKALDYRLACSDFNRDGTSDAFIVGSNGRGYLLNTLTGKPLVPSAQFERGSGGSSISLADINGDGYPEAIFTGKNRLYVVDSSLVPLDGFPVRLTRGVSEDILPTTPLILDLDSNGITDISVATPAGLAYAWNAKGQQLKTSWPRTVGHFESDTAHYRVSWMVGDLSPVDGLELLTAHRDYLDGYALPKAVVRKGANWFTEGGNAQRNYWLDVSSLSNPTQTAGKAEITEFFIFPNPLRSSSAAQAHARFKLGMAASQVNLKIFDISGYQVADYHLGSAGQGKNQRDELDLSHLGSDVYSARLTVTFTNGKRKTKWTRVGVVR